MKKSRPFSLFLLKPGFSETNCLRDDHGLDELAGAAHLPEGARLFLQDSDPYTPWWKDYWGIQKDIWQNSNGLLVILPVGDRYFVLTYGHVSQSLREDAYEYDFGIRTTLNAVDPRELKSTDVHDPGTSRRQRIQSATAAELTFFEFDRDSEIVRSLSGKVREEYKDLLRNATGMTSFHFSSPCPVSEVPSLCQKLLEIYNREDYKVSFPEIHNVTPVREPAVIEKLDAEILRHLQNGSRELSLTVPTIVDYRISPQIRFSGLGASKIHDDVSLIYYTNYVQEHDLNSASIGIEELKKHQLHLCDENGVSKENFSIYKSLILDVQLQGRETAFHLSEGKWYEIDQNFLTRIESLLEPCFLVHDLPPYQQKDEETYNLHVAESVPAYLCLDRTNISTVTNQPMEPCDLLGVVEGVPVYTHVKVSTRSSQLSHLFNQGVGALQLLRGEEKSAEMLQALIRTKARPDATEQFLTAVASRSAKIVFAIITKKNPAGGPRNLPLFSRISLYRAVKFLKPWDVPINITFVADETSPSPGRTRTRKRRLTSKVVAP